MGFDFHDKRQLWLSLPTFDAEYWLNRVVKLQQLLLLPFYSSDSEKSYDFCRRPTFSDHFRLLQKNRNYSSLDEGIRECA